ncbi:curli production assembly/transport component CsgF [Brevundimonas variabilis]|uniref:Curli production assembly/transport component CsgF n=2 Tax=Brevundimonas variabilis TaxID=74312 RepID=A0A7W9CII7_9CAUL|nr:curli assembly protein CsgF [Brevundimonas variabilis]MBB5746288.1 curli production assembly/transport component CsgF [Brevundimonas variabilis]
MVRIAPQLAGWVAGVTVILGVAATSESVAQDITYKPINPTFGGNPFNSAHLLGVANAQNDYRDPNSTSGSSQGDIFARQLQSRLLSAVSSQLVDAIFGDNPQERGTFTLGGQTISFFRDLENVTITVTDDATGEITTIVVPLFFNIL